MFKQVTDIIRAELSGKSQFSSFRKVASQASTAGVLYDLSMASGNPSPNFYSGLELESTTLESHKGIFHGTNQTGQKILKEIQISAGSANGAPSTFVLCDYLMFYPQIDMDSLDSQPMVNSTTLPRYQDGEGCSMFLVAQYPYTGGTSIGISVTYTNSQGTAGRTTGITRFNTAGTIGSIVHSGAATNLSNGGYFLPLQSGDTGVQSVQSIQFDGPAGGLGALVIVKPLATIAINEITAHSETSFVKDVTSIPVIENGAYLNFLCLPAASISAVPFNGHIVTVWE